MNTCRIKGKKREEKEHKIQIVPLRRDEDRLTILWNEWSNPEWQRRCFSKVNPKHIYNLLILNMILLELQTLLSLEWM